ncbi:FAD-binding protein [Pseudosulfitobacter koreensis]|uniref:FAD-binding protein n=1 Tax=Pseudosulfitobacter koreensis TaxID=2968472 RepID=A0ABT1YW93_9RHOB|nr:FAD-binding protein [Pseudosulfitobacter koreense]MCR8825158.1 FAD-binding protein [Pseudosulfitobacter koreense]
MTPQSEAELAALIADARGPLAVQGGGTRGFSGTGDVLSAAGLGGVALYEPGALTLVAGAGTPVAEIEAALAAENQRLAFEPMDHRTLLGTTGTPTIGGVMAANVSGPRRIAVGAARDFALGVRFVDGSGRIVKNGGRVMKNVTGYDLVKLMCGSFGTLGVLTEVAMKVLPRPEIEASLVIDTRDAGQAVAALARGLGSPFEVTGAAFLPDRGAVVRIEGFDGSVAYRLGALEAALAGFGDIERLEAEASRTLWRGVRDVARFAERDGDVWRISVKPSDAPAIVTALPEESDYMLDWGGGLIWVLCAKGTDLRARIAPCAGHATLIRADAPTRARLGVFQPEAPALAALTNGVRARFDPRGVLNATSAQAA